MDESGKIHDEQVLDWLEEHVQVFSDPKTVKLSDFEIDWSHFKGRFRLSLDNVALTEKIEFRLEVCGRTKFFLPMFTSPLGVPASYSAIEISDQTREAITSALHQTIPRLKGLGINRKTGEEITNRTPPYKRILKEELENAMRKVGNDYAITVEVGSM